MLHSFNLVLSELISSLVYVSLISIFNDRNQDIVYENMNDDER